MKKKKQVQNLIIMNNCLFSSITVITNIFGIINCNVNKKAAENLRREVILIVKNCQLQSRAVVSFFQQKNNNIHK